MKVRFERSASFAACPSDAFPTSKSLTASRSLASSWERVAGSSIRSSFVAIGFSSLHTLSGSRCWNWVGARQSISPCIRPVHLRQIRLLQVRLHDLPRRLFSGSGDGADLDSFEDSHPGGRAVALAEGEEVSVGDQGSEDPAVSSCHQVLGGAVEAQAAPVEEEDAAGGGAGVAGAGGG